MLGKEELTRGFLHLKTRVNIIWLKLKKQRIDWKRGQKYLFQEDFNKFIIKKWQKFVCIPTKIPDLKDISKFDYLDIS